jgi:hypothetical protein
MPISRELARSHTQHHTARLARTSSAFWPRYLFHVTHVTNAIAIVQSGLLRCRNQAVVFHDIANQGALAAYSGSHDYARLYFRPKNGFHLRTEGIKCLSDQYRQAFQASVPVTLMFDFETVITRPGVKFTAGNIQRAHNAELDGDEAFATLDFESTYHDQPVAQEHRDYVQDRRMAEVLVPGELALMGALRFIAFRTRYDQLTFEYLLEQAGGQCPFERAVEHPPQSLYMHWGLYLSEMNFIENTLAMRFHLPRHEPADNQFEIDLEQSVPGAPTRTLKTTLKLQPQLTVKGVHADGRAVWRIRLEECLAFEGRLNHARSALFGPPA